MDMVPCRGVVVDRGMRAVAEDNRLWDRLADRYAAQPVADEAAYQTKLVKTRDRLRPEMTVLEFGCGTGSTAIAHAPFVRQIDAIDFSGRMLEIARQKAEAKGISNIRFERSTIEDLVAPAASYDLVMGHSILHLLADKDAVIGKVMNLLKPGGLFVSSTACIGDSMPYIKYVAPLGRAVGLLPRLDVMTRQQLVASHRHAGFDIEEEWQPGKGKAVFLIARKPG